MTDLEKQKAEAEIAKWFWQPAEGHNFRYKYAVRTLTRFYEMVTPAADTLKLILEYLRTQEISGAISLLGKQVDLGSGWVAKDAWYQTAAGDEFAGTKQNKVRVYQTLMLASEYAADGDGPYTVEDGCQYSVEHTFYWNVADLPTLPASSSGIQYTMQGVFRDNETGLFSCVIEKRERVQQDVVEYGTSETAFESRNEEQHIGVKQASVARTGKKASVSSGTIVRRKVTKNPDCTSDVQNETIKEKSVTGAIIEYRKTLRGTMEIKTDRSQSAQVRKTGLAVGETRRSEKTEGGLWNNTVSKTTKDPVGETGEGCERSDLEHRHTTLENLATKPTVEQQRPAVNEALQKSVRLTEEDTWDVTTTRIVYSPKDTGTIISGSQGARTETKVGVNQPTIPAGGVGGINELRRVSAQPNDHGSFSTTEERIVYTPDRVNLQSGNAATTVDLEIGKNQPSVSGGRGGVNQDVTISAQKNDHGSYDYQKRTINYTPDRVNLQSGNAATTVDLEIGKNQPSVSGGRGGVNQDVTISAQKNDHGSYDYQKRTIVYSKAATQTVADWATETVRVKTAINDTNMNPSVNNGEASSQPNDHGSASTRVVEYSPKPVDTGWMTWESTSNLENGTYHYKHGIRVFKNLGSCPTPPSGSNCKVGISVNRFGLFDGEISYTDLIDWKKNDAGGGVYGGSTRGTIKIIQHKVDAYNRTLRRTISVGVIVFYGRGNEGTIASYKANQTIVSGINLPPDTYQVGAVNYGQWEQV